MTISPVLGPVRGGFAFPGGETIITGTISCYFPNEPYVAAMERVRAHREARAWEDFAKIQRGER